MINKHRIFVMHNTVKHFAPICVKNTNEAQIRIKNMLTEFEDAEILHVEKCIKIVEDNTSPDSEDRAQLLEEYKHIIDCCNKKKEILKCDLMPFDEFLKKLENFIHRPVLVVELE